MQITWSFSLSYFLCFYVLVSPRVVLYLKLIISERPKDVLLLGLRRKSKTKLLGF